MKKLKKTYLLLGSNLGDRKLNLTSAADQVTRLVGNIVRKSNIYETEAWGKKDQPEYYNQVLEVKTLLSPEELLSAIHAIENKTGRQRRQQYEARILDIDIIFYDDLVIREPDLTIPHPHLHERNFTLIPLMELIPMKMHPVLNKTIEDLYMESQDPLEVILLEENQ